MSWRAIGSAAVLLSVIPTPVVAQASSNLYFGQEPPGATPVVFAPSLVSIEGRYEQFLLYAPDGGGLTFSITNAAWAEFRLVHMDLRDGRWSEASPAPFVASNPIALTSATSFDLGRVFFTSGLRPSPPVDIWMSERMDENWSEPMRLAEPVSSAANEFEVSIARSGTLYFSSNREGGAGDLDIYRAPLVDGAYPAVERLGPAINTGSGDDLPFIAPDESYLIFASDRPGGLGNRDLYISFQIDGEWTDAANLGAPINTEQWDIYPSISPDGRFMFLTRRDGWVSTDDSDIYWVSAEFIDRLRQQAISRRGSGSR